MKNQEGERWPFLSTRYPKSLLSQMPATQEEVGMAGTFFPCPPCSSGAKLSCQKIVHSLTFPQGRRLSWLDLNLIRSLTLPTLSTPGHIHSSLCTVLFLQTVCDQLRAGSTLGPWDTSPGKVQSRCM